MNNYIDNYIKAQKAYYEACEGINVKKNEQILLKCKTIWSYFFARDILNADIKAHEQVILELKKPEYSCWFARNIAKADIEEHFKVVFNSGNKEWFKYFIKYVNYKGTKIEKWLLFI